MPLGTHISWRWEPTACSDPEMLLVGTQLTVHRWPLGIAYPREGTGSDLDAWQSFQHKTERLILSPKSAFPPGFSLQ